MKILFLLITFTSILFSFDENPEYFKIEGEFTMSINQTIDLVRVEATDKAIKNAKPAHIKTSTHFFDWIRGELKYEITKVKKDIKDNKIIINPPALDNAHPNNDADNI